MSFLFQNEQIALSNISFRKTIKKISLSLLALFTVQNCRTILTVDTEL